GAFGINVRPAMDESGDLTARVNFDPYHAKTADQLIDTWLPITFAMNSINRSMGQNDLYPFFLARPVVAKIAFIHELVHEAAE
ncbi:putative zinc-binding metallopeptidase, partial [Enterococcus faecalis]|uniref:putative zinc-binding metallopeptidase n=1 Tax=Enterococcus faecalis TaxID=1351 RepID=UPI004039DF4F